MAKSPTPAKPRAAKTTVAPVPTAPETPAVIEAPAPAAELSAVNASTDIAASAKAWDDARTELEAVGTATAEAQIALTAAEGNDEAMHEALLLVYAAEQRTAKAKATIEALVSANALGTSPLTVALAQGVTIGVDLAGGPDKSVVEVIDPLPEAAPTASPTDTPESQSPEDESPDGHVAGGGGDPAAPAEAIDRDYLATAIEGAIAEARAIGNRDGADAALAFLATLRASAADAVSNANAFDAALAAEELSQRHTEQVWALTDVRFGGVTYPAGKDLWVDPKTRLALKAMSAVSDEPPTTNEAEAAPSP